MLAGQITEGADEFLHGGVEFTICSTTVFVLAQLVLQHDLSHLADAVQRHAFEDCRFRR